ncbi:hypothetical protein LTR56_018986 [Elasticomyces elasticus]|nr:hypothetical protein LTR56_018986 [Elasticomyces elasticus]KAK4911751.1 hypothetical protein LTR49_019741 [Elasticomyces elasticus]KAK5769788.1 hypothetical protein LTS12_000238 [Elasticomyces elasticus]
MASSTSYTSDAGENVSENEHDSDREHKLFRLLDLRLELWDLVVVPLLPPAIPDSEILPWPLEPPPPMPPTPPPVAPPPPAVVLPPAPASAFQFSMDEFKLNVKTRAKKEKEGGKKEGGKKEGGKKEGGKKEGGKKEGGKKEGGKKKEKEEDEEDNEDEDEDEVKGNVSRKVVKRPARASTI